MCVGEKRLPEKTPNISIYSSNRRFKDKNLAIEEKKRDHPFWSMLDPKKGWPHNELIRLSPAGLPFCCAFSDDDWNAGWHFRNSFARSHNDSSFSFVRTPILDLYFAMDSYRAEFRRELIHIFIYNLFFLGNCSKQNKESITWQKWNTKHICFEHTW